MHKDSPVAETINTLTAYPFPFFFFVGPSLCITDETREEICWEKLTPLWVSSYSPISCTKSTLCSVHKDSPVAKTINTLTAFPFPPFCGTKSLHHRLRLRKRFVGWNWLLCESVLIHPSLVQSPLSVQRIKTVLWPKQSTHSLHILFLFLVGPSLCIAD